MADQLGLTFQQLQKYEKGMNRIGGSRMHQLAQILQVPVGFFYEGLPTAGASADGRSLAGDLTTSFFSLPHAAELAEGFTSLSPEQRRVVFDVAQALDHEHLRAAVKKVA